MYSQFSFPSDSSILSHLNLFEQKLIPHWL
jgi:hypothetical protein